MFDSMQELGRKKLGHASLPLLIYVQKDTKVMTMNALKFIPIFLVFLLFANCVFALGISEGRIQLNYTFKMDRNLTLTVINNENRTIHVILYARDNVYH